MDFCIYSLNYYTNSNLIPYSFTNTSNARCHLTYGEIVDKNIDTSIKQHSSTKLLINGCARQKAWVWSVRNIRIHQALLLVAVCAF